MDKWQYFTTWDRKWDKKMGLNIPSEMKWNSGDWDRLAGRGG